MTDIVPWGRDLRTRTLQQAPLCQCSHSARPQVSEDHCWLSLDGSGERAAAVEVTTDTAAKRGLAPSEAAWRGWLYSGGTAVVCSPQVASARALSGIGFKD